MKASKLLGVTLIFMPPLVSIMVMLWQDWRTALFVVGCTTAIVGSVGVGAWLLYKEQTAKERGEG